MKKIILLRPEESRTIYNFKGIIENECLDLEIIYTLLKDKYDVRIYDLQVEDISFKKHILNNKYDVLYVEGRSFQEGYMKEYISDFKKICDGLVIVGGQHAQNNYEIFYLDDVDYILSGYNYYDLENIIENNITDINNLHYKKDNKWISTERKATDINDLPIPDRSYFYNHPNNYQYLDLNHAMWIRSSFSCPYKCEFCIRRKMNNSTYSRRDLISLVDEIENNDNEVVYLVDDDFLYDERYVSEFINLIKERNINRKYICYGRADFIKRNEGLLKQFKEIGLFYVLVGLEDINNESLSQYNKLSFIDINEECIRICKKYDIRIMAMFILGLDFIKKDFDELYRYIVDRDLRHVAVSIYTPEKGNKHDYEYISDNPSDFDYIHLVCKPKNISVRRYYFYYYILLIKLFIRAYRQGVYSFIDYKYYIKSFLKNIISGRVNDYE